MEPICCSRSPKSHAQKAAEILQKFRKSSGQITQGGKSTTHLFRPRQASQKIDMHHLNQVLSIDTEKRIAHAEGMATFYDIAEAAIQKGFVPKVVPELRTITIGGGISGLAIESSSIKYGLVHETVQEIEVLTGAGEIVTAKRGDELFKALPNSYGSIGYVLSAKVELVPIKPYVALQYRHFDKPEPFFAAMKAATTPDFVDGAIFSPDHFVLVTGTFTDEAPTLTRYPSDGIYYKDIQSKNESCLTIRDYLWRWDNDYFWATEGTFLQNPTFRKLFGSSVLRSDRLRRLGNWKKKLDRKLIHPFTKPPRAEELIQDLGIRIDRCAAFYRWYAEEIGIHPLFICPSRSDESYPLWPLPAGEMFCDVGFYDHKITDKEPGYYNRLIEAKTVELGGRKSLYSRVFYDRDTFYRLYNGDEYFRLKSKYDPRNRLPDLHSKCFTDSDA